MFTVMFYLLLGCIFPFGLIWYYCIFSGLWSDDDGVFLCLCVFPTIFYCLLLIFGIQRRIYIEIVKFVHGDNILIRNRKWVVLIVSSLLTYVYEGEEFPNLMVAITMFLLLFIMTTIKLVCVSSDKTGIIDFIYHLFLHILIQNVLHHHVLASTCSVLVVLHCVLFQITPNGLDFSLEENDPVLETREILESTTEIERKMGVKNLVTAILFFVILVLASFGMICPMEWFSDYATMMVVLLVCLCLSTTMLHSDVYRVVYLTIVEIVGGNNIITRNRVWVNLVISSIISYICGGDQAYPDLILKIVCLCLMILAIIKLVCDPSDESGIAHFLHHVFLHLFLQNLFHGHQLGFICSAAVLLLSVLVEIMPNAKDYTQQEINELLNMIGNPSLLVAGFWSWACGA